jgi:ketosteroid isomerase-like protein
MKFPISILGSASLLMAIGLASISACAAGEDSDVAAIRTAREASNQALKHRDIRAFAASLDEDFVMIRGNGVLVPTRQAYIDTFQQDFSSPQSVSYRRAPDKINLSSAAPLAAEHGHWQGRRPNGTVAYGGTYLAMWRKDSGGWKIRSELFVVLDGVRR